MGKQNNPGYGTQRSLGFEPGRTQGDDTPGRPFQPGPNAELPDFLRRHATPYDPETDTYDVPAFDRDLAVDKAHPPKAIYDMHRYWSKKHWASIAEYVHHYLPSKYYPPGQGLVLDCFSGSGMTGVAASMQGRPALLLDVSPAAAFISHCYTHPVDPSYLRASVDRMLTTSYPDGLRDSLREVTGTKITCLSEELGWLFETRCDRCGGKATTEYVVYSERFQCQGCGEIVTLYECREFRTPKKGRYCPFCLSTHGGRPHLDFLVSTRRKKFGAIPVMVSCRCLSGCRPSRARRSIEDTSTSRRGRYFREHDLSKLAFIEEAKIPHPYPVRRMMDVQDDLQPWGVKWRAGVANFRTVAELFTKRNLWALSAWAEMASHELTKLALTKTSLSSSRMNCNREAGGGLTAGKYLIPPESRILNAAERLLSAMDDVLSGNEALWVSISPQAEVLVSNASAEVLDEIDEACIDYVFTDPPYLNLEVQYGEMNFIWESWLGFPGDWLAHEIAFNPVRGIDWETAVARLRAVIARLFRLLKPGRYASICYHDTSERNWTLLQDALLDAGFEIANVLVLDPKQKSQDQGTKEKVVKSDLVVNCIKPRHPRGTNRDEDPQEETASRRVREIVIETLGRAGGQPRDRLWDTVLKRLLTRRQMAEHRFDDILAEVAFRSESGRWFLKEEFEQLSQSDVKNEEEAGAALVRFARLRCEGAPVQLSAHIALAVPMLAEEGVPDKDLEGYIQTELIRDPAAAKKFRLGGRMRGVEFYDCLFFYLTRFLKGRSGGKTPRRNLAEFLEEYLVRFKDGDKWLYRAPDRAEAESLKRSRQTGLGRRIRQFCSFLRGEGELPKEKLPDAKTLVGWLKHCAAFGLADEGVLLFEKGGLAGQLIQLGEDARFDAEDYYSQCKRKASRTTSPEGDGLEEDEDGGEGDE